MAEQQTGGDVSRRHLLTGLAVAGGVGLTAGALPTAASAADSGALATGPDGSTVVEFRARIAQTGGSGQTFTSFGYLTAVAGAAPDELFSGGPPGESTALLTAFATGSLAARTFDQMVHALDIDGELTVFQRDVPGASFADPDSFRQGSAVARFDLTLQDVLTVFTPGRGLPTLTGDMTQTHSHGLAGELSGRRFGRQGLRLRFLATGLGTLLDAATSNSSLEIAGNWSVE